MTRKVQKTRLINTASPLIGRPRQANRIFFAIESDRGLSLGRSGAGITTNRAWKNEIVCLDDKNLN